MTIPDSEPPDTCRDTKSKMTPEPSPAVIMVHLEKIQTDIRRVEKSLEHRYVTQDQIKPLVTFVYGFMGRIGSGVIAGVFALLWRTQ